MPKMPLVPENKAKSQYDYPRLQLDFGERARIVCIEKEPETAWIHTLKSPTLINGEAVYETVKTKKGDEIQQMKTDFVGRHVCVGSLDIIAEKGLDEDGCPVCAESIRSNAVSSPERRFAMHVIRYKTKPGAFTIQEPFQAELVVWAFGDKILNTLIDIADEHGDLKKKDLLLGPCTQKQYQTFDIHAAAKAEWTEETDRMKMVKEIYQNNQIADLMVAIGRTITRDQVLEDLEKVMRNYNIAHGKSTAPSIEDVSGQIDAASLLDDSSDGLSEFAEPDTGDAGGEKVNSKKEEPKKAADDELDLSEFLDL